MKKAMNLSLRAGERIYVNGAVLRVDRKVTLELLNDATFLLENQVMQPEQAITPLRQLYFVVQLMLIEPDQASAKLELFTQQVIAMLAICRDVEIIAGITAGTELVAKNRYHEALKTIRALFVIEDAIRDDALPAKPTEAA
jgi:flagellar protein FlbT